MAKVNPFIRVKELTVVHFFLGKNFYYYNIETPDEVIRHDFKCNINSGSNHNPLLTQINVVKIKRKRLPHMRA